MLTLYPLLISASITRLCFVTSILFFPVITLNEIILASSLLSHADGGTADEKEILEATVNATAKTATVPMAKLKLTDFTPMRLLLKTNLLWETKYANSP
jgi:hypothetical protein